MVSLGDANMKDYDKYSITNPINQFPMIVSKDTAPDCGSIILMKNQWKMIRSSIVLKNMNAQGNSLISSLIFCVGLCYDKN